MVNFFRSFWIINNMCGIWYIFIGFLAFPGPSCSNSDNLALLLDTLKVVQRSVCNNETVSLACPRGTTISIQVAQYSIGTMKQGCPALSTSDAEESRNCKLPNAMQYSLLQKVVEECQKKPQCKFSTQSVPAPNDSCAKQNKYVEVAYKCRPYEFRSLTSCEGEGIRLSCNPHSRIAIFDALYGRKAFEANTCPQRQGVSDETCNAPHAVKTVIQMCLGRRRCQIAANSRIFNTTCKPQSRPYLNVVYACVPLGVLSEKYESAAENDEIGTTFNQNKSLYDESGLVEGESYREPNVDRALQPPFIEEIPTPTRNAREQQTTSEEPGNPVKKHEDPQYRLTLFLYIGLGILILLIVVGLIGVIIVFYNNQKERRITKNSKNGEMYTTDPPNIFSDAFSDIDNDADISHISGTFHDPVHPDMILYKNVPGSIGTIRAMKPLCTIYPSTVESNMYGNVDYVPSYAREQIIAPRFTRSRSNEEGMEPTVMTSPRSLGAHSSHYYYG